MTSHPEPLDQDAVARIIRRAVEIDAVLPGHDGMSVDSLVQAAGEVGVASESVRHAVALDRLEQAVPQRVGRADALVGPAEVLVERELPMAGDELRARIEERLAGNHHLRRIDSRDDKSVWEKRSDVAANVQLAARRLVGDGRLGGVKRVVVAVQQLPPSGDEAQAVRSIARISVHRHGARTGALVGGTAVSAAGVGAALVGGVLVAPAVGLVAVPGLALGAAVTLGTKSKARSIETELKLLLDQVLRDDPEPTTRRWINRVLPD